MTISKIVNAKPPYRIGLSRQEIYTRILDNAPIKEIPAIIVEEPQSIEIAEDNAPEVIEEIVTVPEVTENVTEDTVITEEPEAVVIEDAPADNLELLGISEKLIAALKVNGINTISDLTKVIDAGTDLENLEKIGKASKKTILEAWNAQKQTI